MALSAAYSAYEARFSHPFVICLDGVSRHEVLDLLLAAVRSRLTNDLEDERVVTAEELRRLARGRLERRLRARGGTEQQLRRPAHPLTARPQSADDHAHLPASRRPANPSVHL
jgi:hypothetical protein